VILIGFTDGAEKMQPNAADLTVGAPPKSSGKLRLRTLGHLDGRTRARKRANELIELFTAELGGSPSAGQRFAIERAAMLVAIAEDAASRQLAGEALDLDKIVRVANAARRAVCDLVSTRKA
jgi:hypothetical protein